ncbi:L-serine ammonia-lyase [Capnocytophaga felis]|uniref:L-serine dehydratase n=1 Tax=Capnocytophaga felis TaxID=2267611 RepID=A0A5M4B5C6_9FLAO|nr:L-serine ammonia-lyase [Capnocytophaga felis]GET44804.1 L-serine ammonia-lyase [Capnocytophaga felis]GET48669.1 L-serine ammonia-lyase [Capnocytophaga felis]
MECISVFDMLKIGVGPSSSHTLGPWRAAEAFLKELKSEKLLDRTQKVRVDLYGSLSLTGKGHATDLAVMFGLSGADPEYVPIESLDVIITAINKNQEICLGNEFIIKFNPAEDIVFNRNFLPFHSNGISFTAWGEGFEYQSTFYSIGGGFIVKEGEDAPITEDTKRFPFPIEKATELLDYCHKEGKKISEIVYQNERSLRSDEEIHNELLRIWNTMLECTYIGCHTEGILPGGLNVRRRAYDTHKNLIGVVTYDSPKSWLTSIKKTEIKFREILKWVNCFSLAVNEVNASLGRVVTAPTNGSAGVIPAVLLYYLVIENHNATEEDVKQFLLVAGEIGSLFKKGATISAAMGGCQAEIGVSSAMAAAGLCEVMGGSPEQVMVAAEIAMEHHLGLTCDPIGGLVQVPCIERNAMGAIKAINAAELAIETDPKNAKVPLDKVINTMWETAKDMNSKYKETSEGGLAVAVNIADC